MPQILPNLFALLLIVLTETEKSFGQQSNCSRSQVSSPLLEGFFNDHNRFAIRLNVAEWNDQGTDMDEELPLPYASFPFLAKIHGGQVDTMSKRRHRRDIYAECCRKQYSQINYILINGSRPKHSPNIYLYRRWMTYSN